MSNPAKRMNPQQMVQGIEEALLHRLNPSASLTDGGREFAYLSLAEIGREILDAKGVTTQGLTRSEMVRGMMSTSDFQSLMANVANKRLRELYNENPGTFRLWARRAQDAPNFKPIQVTQVSAMPELLRTTEAGEFSYGTLSDGDETYQLLTYGRIVSLSREAIVNDDLRAFDRMVAGFAASAARLENRLVYAQLTANAALSDSVALFHATHANLAGSGGAIDVTTLGAGRAAMRKQKGLQNEELNLSPSFLIVPTALEQVAYQYTSANYVPATPANVNEFRAGGKTSLTPVVEPLLDADSATAWYLAARNSQVDTVEYCFLGGADAPVIDSKAGFDVDGIKWRARHDFAAKVIDFRGLYRNAGA